MIRTKDNFIGRTVKITYCWSCSPAYFNLQPKTTHIIVPAPENCKNSDRGVWVRGVGQFVYLQKGEYEFTLVRTKFNNK
jgi:hypothetical protein